MPRGELDRESGDRHRWRPDVLPDGREALTFGEVRELAADWHEQGDNLAGFQQTCGLCCVEAIARRHGNEITENDVVELARALRLCDVSARRPEACGMTTEGQLMELLARLGIGSEKRSFDGLEKLEEPLTRDQPIAIMVNARHLNRLPFGDPDGPNHAVMVTGITRTPDGRIAGCYINDTGHRDGRGKFVDRATLERAWLDQGGWALVADSAGRRQ